MKKIFVLDTNVLLADPDSIFKMEENDLILPIQVIEEVDKFKKDQSDIGRNARQVSRHLDKLRVPGSSLAAGVALGAGGSLRVEVGRDAEKYFPFPEDKALPDNRILAVALKYRAEAPDRTVIFISRDINLRIKADALGLIAEDYQSDHVPIEELYTGMKELPLDPAGLNRFYQEGGAPYDAAWGLLPNQYAFFRDAADQKHTAVGRYDEHNQRVAALPRKPVNAWGIMGRNLEQRIALDLLFNKEIHLVTLAGSAGTGKTLLAIAAGLAQTADERAYKKMLVARPIFPMGRDVGFLPGELREKLKPWMQPIHDNLEFILNHDNEDDQSGSAEELQRQGVIEIEALTYIRGRSIPRQFFVVDEAQNLSPHEVKTIITRAGEGTKIVLTGDPYQIDNPYLDTSNNGLTYVIERFKGQWIAGHVTLMRGERSSLSQKAAELL